MLAVNVSVNQAYTVFTLFSVPHVPLSFLYLLTAETTSNLRYKHQNQPSYLYIPSRACSEYCHLNTNVT